MPVEAIVTSDGRSWQILSDPTSLQITGIVPSVNQGGKGPLYFGWGDTNDTGGIHQAGFMHLVDGVPCVYAGRPTEVRTDPVSGQGVLYKFNYDPITGELLERWEGSRLITSYEQESGSLVRKEWLDGESSYRRVEHTYSTTTDHYVVSVKEYPELDGAGTPAITTYRFKGGTQFDNDHQAGFLESVVLPGAVTVSHSYDFENLGLRTNTRVGSEVTYDVDFDLAYIIDGYGFERRLLSMPRIISERDGRGNQVSYVYEAADQDGDGVLHKPDGVYGDERNQLWSITGPAVTTPGNGRTPETRYTYYDVGPKGGLLRMTETKRGSGWEDAFVTRYDYDEQRRLKLKSVGKGVSGQVSTTEYRTVESQRDVYDKPIHTLVRDPDGYVVKTELDHDGRVASVTRYLAPLSSSILDLDVPTLTDLLAHHRTYYDYDARGWLQFTRTQNKSQTGDWIGGSENYVTTKHTRDSVGRITRTQVGSSTRSGDVSGVDSDVNYAYTDQGEINYQYDSSERGVYKEYDGRGLLKMEAPLVEGTGAADLLLKTEYNYWPNGKLRETILPDGVKISRTYDSALRLETETRTPASMNYGETERTTHYVYDDAGNAIRTYVTNGAGTYLSDEAQWYDQGGQNYRSAQYWVPCNTQGTECAGEPTTATARVAQRSYDHAGNVILETQLGDATVADRLVHTEYDSRGWISRTWDELDGALNGQTEYSRDKRGNVIEQRVRLDAKNTAVTNTAYDAHSRAVSVLYPKAGADINLRHSKTLTYDSLGNLHREFMFDENDPDLSTATVYDYDTAGRKIMEAAKADSSPPMGPPPYTALNSSDRVKRFEYDDGGRLLKTTTYNVSNTNPGLQTITTYDDHGRVESVTLPDGTWTVNHYAPDGKLEWREYFDGLGTRQTFFGYDGLGRLISETAQGDPQITPASPPLVTRYGYDALDRKVSDTDARGIVRHTSYLDMLGTQMLVTEDYIENPAVSATSRSTLQIHNALGQLVEQVFTNVTGDPPAPVEQRTTYRHDPFGRTTRIVYPDAGNAEHAAPENCQDCVKLVYDAGGRLTQKRTQNPDSVVTNYRYDDRGSLIAKDSTGGPSEDPIDAAERFYSNALGTVTYASRGNSRNPKFLSEVYFAYTPLGDLQEDSQRIKTTPPRIFHADHDQAGNRTQISYPGSLLLTYSVADDSDRILYITPDDGGSFNVEYSYYGDGPLLAERRTSAGVNAYYSFTFADPAGTVGYDAHRNRRSLTNKYRSSVGAITTIASYGYTHDENSNPRSQTTTADLPAFHGDDRLFEVDNLNLLTSTVFGVAPQASPADAMTLDLAGNRLDYTTRNGAATTYAEASEVNEYPQIDQEDVMYDPRGNLSRDEDGRRYFYDEENRLSRVLAPAPSARVLAAYSYDALGRRIESIIGGKITRYYYDGHSVVEEYNSANQLLRFHVNGTQYIDERVATYDVATGKWLYYIHKENWSVAGIAYSDGSCDALIYSPTGDFSGNQPTRDWHGDAGTPDGDVDEDDFAVLQSCFTGPGVAVPTGGDCGKTDLDRDADVDAADYALFQVCMSGPGVSPPPGCTTIIPKTGTLLLHGLALDVIPEGPTLLFARARYYDTKHGRWLQRDPKGYVDGPNLYEAFKGNPLRYVDPTGTQAPGWLGGTPYDVWGEEYRKHCCPPPGTTKRALASTVIETEGKTDREIDYELKKEFYYTAEAIVLMVAVVNPVAEAALKEQSPRLASAITDRARLEIGVLGPTQGVLNAAQGVQDIGVDFLNLGMRSSPGMQTVLILMPELEEQTRIDSPQWAKDLALHTSDKTYNWSKGMGGQVILILVPIRAEAWIQGAGRTVASGQSLKVLNAEFVPDTAKVMQNIVTRVEGQIAKQPGIIRGVVSRQEHLALKAGGPQGPRVYGQAVEKMSAEVVAADPALRELFSHVGRVQDPITGRFMTSPDFFGWEPGRIRLLDITTSREVPSHLFRPWASPEDMIIHSGGHGLVYP